MFTVICVKRRPSEEHASDTKQNVKTVLWQTRCSLSGRLQAPLTYSANYKPARPTRSTLKSKCWFFVVVVVVFALSRQSQNCYVSSEWVKHKWRGEQTLKGTGSLSYLPGSTNRVMLWSDTSGSQCVCARAAAASAPRVRTVEELAIRSGYVWLSSLSEEYYL